jgi:hypothetical protein
MFELHTNYGIKQRLVSVTVALIRSALEKVLEDAERKREDAGHAGSMGDNGASILEIKVDAYIKGWQQVIPNWLEDYILHVQTEADPEFAEYKRLHEKFSGQTPSKEKRDFTTKIPHWTDKDKKGKITVNEDILKDFR